MKDTLNSRLIKKKILELAGAVYFKRGQEYFDYGCVEDFRQTGDSIRATVLGSSLYSVRIWLGGGRISYSCDCPVGSDGEFCKHLVAASLAWLAAADKRGKAAPGVTEADIRASLAVLDKEDLIAFIMKQAGASGEFYDQLMHAAGSGQGRRRLVQRPRRRPGNSRRFTGIRATAAGSGRRLSERDR